MNDSGDYQADPELVRRSLAGEVAAFAQLVERHQRLVFGVALSSARDAAIAEEVAQEAFVEAWRELPRLRDPGRVGSWIAGIARNLARAWSRTSSRRHRQDEVVAAEQALSVRVETPLDAALVRENNMLLGQALDAIPSAYREVLVLFYVHGKSIRDVSAGLGVSEDVVKQRLLRGRNALRDSLENEIEVALGNARPSKAFTAAVTVAVSSSIATRSAAAATGASTAGKLITIMATQKLFLGVASLVVATGVVWFGMTHGDAAAPKRAAAPTPATSDRPIASADPARNGSRAGARRLAGASEREQILQMIHQAQQRRMRSMTASPASGQAGGGTTPSYEPHDLDKDYVRSSVGELVPFLAECYEAMLEAHVSEAGKVVVNFTIEGEPETGGLVTECDIDDEKSEIKNAEFRECMRETMFALQIDPPADGHPVKVVYPFEFRPTTPEERADLLQR